MLLNKMVSDRKLNLFAFVVLGGYLIYRGTLIFSPHPDAGGVENNVIWFIQRLLDGGHLYTNPEVSPYAIAQYSPLYYYINAGIARLLGINADDVLSLFVLSRTVSLILNLVYAALIMAIAKNIFNCAVQRAFTAGVFAFIFLEITSFSRPDSLNHVFFFLSFYSFEVVLKKNETGKKAVTYLLLSAIFACCALFSKQSSIVLLLIMFAWFIRKKQIKLLFTWFLTYAALLAVGVYIVHAESGLKPFYQNTVLGINNGISTHWFWSNIIKEFYRQFGLLWVPALILVVTLMKKEKSHRYQFTLISIIIVFIFSNLIALKWGSSPGYFTEWCALVFIGMAVYWDVIFTGVKIFYRKISAAVVGFILLIKLMLISYPLWDMIRPGAKKFAIERYLGETALAERIKNKLQNKPGHTVFNNLYSPDTYLNNLLFRQSVLPQFEVVIFGTWNNKVFDYAGFRREIDDGTIQYVVERPGDPLQFMDINLSKFRLADSLYNGYYIYQYNP